MSTLVDHDIAIPAPDKHEIYRLCLPIFPVGEFASSTTFHCDQYAPFSEITGGTFQLTCRWFSGGKEVRTVAQPAVGQNDILEINYTQELESGLDNGMAIVEILHPSDQSIDPYVVYQHIATGMIVSHPLLLFMGCAGLGEWLGHHLENALFWSGLVGNREFESVLVVLNPYDTSLKYQVTLYGKGTLIETSKVLHLPSKTMHQVSLEDIFPRALNHIQDSGSELSVCISTQYAAKALFGIRHRREGYFTVLDHLNEYMFR